MHCHYSQSLAFLGLMVEVFMRHDVVFHSGIRFPLAKGHELGVLFLTWPCLLLSTMDEEHEGYTLRALIKLPRPNKSLTLLFSPSPWIVTCPQMTHISLCVYTSGFEVSLLQEIGYVPPVMATEKNP
jgi:hypothetical protein